jgi:hypothetical protein
MEGVVRRGAVQRLAFLDPRRGEFLHVFRPDSPP